MKTRTGGVATDDARAPFAGTVVLSEDESLLEGGTGWSLLRPAHAIRSGAASAQMLRGMRADRRAVGRKIMSGWGIGRVWMRV
ncbi:MAG: hypothetical protein ACR2MQ_01365 [Gemmatimonadaceae bacterium]